MSNDRKAVILGRLQRFTTVTPCLQASGPFRPLRSGRCPRSLDPCTASRPPARDRGAGEGRGRGGAGEAGGAVIRWVGARGSGTSPGEKGRAARVCKEDWTLVRSRDRRGWTGAARGRFERVTLGAGGGRARAEFRWNAEKGGLGTGTCGWA